MKRAREFATVRTHGTSAAGRFLVLSTAPLTGDASRHSLFGIVATKRVANAVVRNRLRRRVREILRACGEPLSRGLYVVIILRHRAVYASYRDLQADLLKLLPRCVGAPHVPSPC